MVACFRIGAVALPCNEQLRAKDLRPRLDAARPRLIVADERNAAELQAARPRDCEVAADPRPDAAGLTSRRPPSSSTPTDPCLITFTSGTTGEAKGIVHGQRYLPGQPLQAEHWLDARPGDLVWCTAASGWSKSARNVFIAPWLRGAAALLHDARFDPEERLEILAAEQVNVLCMAPTEYRVIAKRAAARARARAARAGRRRRGAEPRGAAGLPGGRPAWRSATATARPRPGQLTGVPAGGDVRPGSMGRPLPGVALEIVDGELVLTDPRTDPTFFVGYLDGDARARDMPWRTGDRVQRDEDGYLYFEGRADDVIISAGYRIGPFEVESALVSHAAVAEAAVVAAPDEERGAVVRAVVVLRDGYAAADDARRRAPGPRQARDRPVQVPADRRLRRRAAQDGQRQGPARAAARAPSRSLA